MSGTSASPVGSDDDRLLSSDRPQILRRGVIHWPAMQWTLDTLEAHVGDRIVSVQTGLWKPTPGRVGRDGAPARMPAHRFFGALRSGEDCGYLAGSALLRRGDRLRKDLRFPTGGRLHTDVSWIGPAGTATPVHFDIAPNFYAQLRGRKRWRLWAPRSRLKPRFGGIGAFAMSRLDAGAGPDAAGAPDHDFVLEPGDALFLPAGWWHRVDTLQTSISVNRWWIGPAIGWRRSAAILLRPSHKR